MKINNGQVAEAQGAETKERIPTLNEVKEFLKNDLSKSIALLDAIYRDQNTMNNLAEFLLGRFINAKEQEKLKNQTKLDL